MGLNHPRDLTAWRQWQQRTHPIRGAVGRLRGEQRQPDTAVYLRGTSPRVLAALEATTPSQVAANLAFLGHMTDDVAVLAPGRIAEFDDDVAWRRFDGPEPSVFEGLRVAVASGTYLPMGALADLIVRSRGGRLVVVQHGLMTPFAPPLPADAHLLSASECDAEFWRSGRDDVTSETVGLQLLWDAATEARERPDARERALASRPVFLGQLHGAELPRRDSARTAEAFCLATGANYRPHPAETDRLSGWQHERWRRRGVTLDRRRIALRDVTAPVASVFSTGVLEAAARGLPAWAVFAGQPPAWVVEFWQRYGIRRLDLDQVRTESTPFDADRFASTPAPEQQSVEPAVAIARAVERIAGAAS